MKWLHFLISLNYDAVGMKVYGRFSPWLYRSKSVSSNQKLDHSTQVTKFGLAVDERTRNNLYACWSELTWRSLEQSNHGAKWRDTGLNSALVGLSSTQVCCWEYDFIDGNMILTLTTKLIMFVSCTCINIQLFVTFWAFCHGKSYRLPLGYCYRGLETRL